MDSDSIPISNNSDLNFNIDSSLLITIFFCIYILSLCFVIVSLIRRKHIQSKKSRRKKSITYLVISYFLLFVIFMFLVYLVNTDKNICPNLGKEVTGEYWLIVLVFISNIGILLRNTRVEYYSYINYLFTAFNLIVSIDLAIKIIYRC